MSRREKRPTGPHRSGGRALLAVFKSLSDKASQSFCSSFGGMAPEKTAPLGSIENPIKFRDQDFKSLFDECQQSGVLFSDPTFVAEQKSIGIPEDSDPKKTIKWKRPKVRCFLMTKL